MKSGYSLGRGLLDLTAARTLVLALALLLAGCASDPGISEDQLSAAEIRDGVVAPAADKRWVAPLTAAQATTLAQARSAWSEGQPEQAQALLKELLAERPEHPDLLANMALVALDQGRQDQARQLFEEALKVVPGHRMASNNLALILKSQGDFIEARRVLARALERHPDEAILHYNLAVIYELYLQDLKKALDHYRRYQALAVEPDAQVAGWMVDIERRIQ